MSTTDRANDPQLRWVQILLGVIAAAGGVWKGVALGFSPWDIAWVVTWVVWIVNASVHLHRIHRERGARPRGPGARDGSPAGK